MRLSLLSVCGPWCAGSPCEWGCTPRLLTSPPWGPRRLLALADEQGGLRRALSHLGDSPSCARVRTAPQGHASSPRPFPWGPSSRRNGAAWCAAPSPQVRQAFPSHIRADCVQGSVSISRCRGAGPHRTVCVSTFFAFSFTRGYSLCQLYVSEHFKFNRI